MAENVVTMVFTDLVSSTAIKLKLPGSDITESNRLYRDTILIPHRQRVMSILEVYGGRKVETIGDAFFLVFANPCDAVECAIAIQMSHMATPIPTPLGALQVTIGIHTGSPLADDDRFIGHEVDYAARVAALATGGQILLSEVTAVLVRDAHIAGLKLYRHSDRNLKGIGSVPIFEALYHNKQPQLLKDSSTAQTSKNTQEVIPVYQSALAEAAQTETENLAALKLTLPPEVQKQLENLLAAKIGPLATFLLKEALEEVSTLPNLVELLVHHVPEPLKVQFREQATTLLKKLDPNVSAIPQDQSKNSTPVTNAIPSKNNNLDPVEPSFIQRCELELAKLIGPMATFIVQQTLSKNSKVSRHQLVETLATQIPMPQKAQEFRQRLLA